MATRTPTTTTPAGDPVAVAQAAVRKHLERLFGITIAEQQCVIVEIGLAAIRAEGWRMVRTSPAGDDVMQVVMSGGEEWVTPIGPDVVRIDAEWRA